jgi:hypothetical protein
LTLKGRSAAGFADIFIDLTLLRHMPYHEIIEGSRLPHSAAAGGATAVGAAANLAGAKGEFRTR